MEELEKCPIETALDYLRNKWTIEIIRDLFMDRTRFSEFQKSNPKISKNVLSERLKDLISKGIVEKRINEKDLKIEYKLSSKGRRLNKVIYELGAFACGCGIDEGKYSHKCVDATLGFLKKAFKIENK